MPDIPLIIADAVNLAPGHAAPENGRRFVDQHAHARIEFSAVSATDLIKGPGQPAQLFLRHFPGVPEHHKPIAHELDHDGKSRPERTTGPEVVFREPVTDVAEKPLQEIVKKPGGSQARVYLVAESREAGKVEHSGNGLS